MGKQLNGVKRCPHCSIASPSLTRVWASDGPTHRTDGGTPQHWGAFRCVSCGSLIAAWGVETQHGFGIVQTYPEVKAAHEDIPNPARTFLQQAFDTLHAPDAAAVMAGSAVDAMLKHHGLSDGSLYSRIDQALEQNLLTKGMANWAHEVGLGQIAHATQMRNGPT